MATTDTRPGFRLPWSGDREAQATAVATETVDETTRPEEAESSTTDAAGTTETTETTDRLDATDAGTTIAEATDPGAAPAEPAAAPQQVPFGATTYAPSSGPAPAEPARKPSKFLADLTRAMRSAAESERGEIVERFQAEAKTFVEGVHERSAGDVVGLRKQADEDIAGIRDWSKAEIARIREQTDQRISERKRDLDEELEAHAARVEREIDRIRKTVEGYETVMARFFEELLAVEDPTRFAAMAESMPEPPSLGDIAAGTATFDPAPVLVPAAVTAAVAESPATEVEAVAETEPVAETAGESTTSRSDPDDPWRDMSFRSPDPEPVEVPDAQAEGAAPVEAVETEPDQVPEVEAVPETEAEPATGEASDEPTTDETHESEMDGAAEPQAAIEVDPRVSALGLTPDLAAAEAEALHGATEDDDSGADDVPALDDETIAARLASLTPSEPTVEPQRTQVVVTGLASVASISGFKRTLAQLAGVRQVSVASGPDGEFVFAVTHGPAVDLAAIVPTMGGFAARVLSTDDGVLRVAAHDPEHAA